MFQLIMNNPLWYLIAFVIGVATAWWIWGRLGSIVADASDRASGMASGVVDTVGDAASSTVDVAKGAAGSVAGAASDTVGAAGNMASGAAGAVVGGVTAAGAGVAAAASSAAEAAGGLVDGPKIAAAVGESDDLTRIKGIGPKLSDLCQSLGVRRFDQIAQWGPADVAEVDQYLNIKGRIDRDRWVDQAKLLAAGNEDAHKAEFG